MLKLTAVATVLNVFFFGFGYANANVKRNRRTASTAGRDDREHACGASADTRAGSDPPPWCPHHDDRTPHHYPPLLGVCEPRGSCPGVGVARSPTGPLRAGAISFSATRPVSGSRATRSPVPPAGRSIRPARV